MQIIRNIVQARLYESCIRSGIFYILLGGFFVYRGLQAVFYMILKKVNTKITYIGICCPGVIAKDNQNETTTLCHEHRFLCTRHDN